MRPTVQPAAGRSPPPPTERRRRMLACFSGEGGIRTLERTFGRYSLSRRVPSAARPPLQQTFDSMHRMVILTVAAAALLLLLVAIQLGLPPFLEHRAESKLTKHGGHARVHL